MASTLSGLCLDLLMASGKGFSPRRIAICESSQGDGIRVYISGCDENAVSVFARLLNDHNLCLGSIVEDGCMYTGFYVTDHNGERHVKLSKEACTELEIRLRELFPEACIALLLSQQSESMTRDDGLLTSHQIEHGLQDMPIDDFDFTDQLINSDVEVPVVRVEKPVTAENLTDKLKHCAQAISSAKRRKAHKLLHEIRIYSSRTGNASERLAYCFANGLEARLSGNWNSIYQKIFTGEITQIDIQKAFEVYYKGCPIQKASHFFSNQTIIDQIKDAKSVHIIDWGIGFGFQWPQLIEYLSKMVGGPPKLQITGIDMPLPGLYPTNQMKHAKILLEHYAQHFNVPFEYRGIESKWEDVTVESLNIDRDEVLIVNCLSHSGYISGDTLAMHGPSDPVLELIRELNPAAFVHGRAAVSSEAPSFVSCFEEALLHYSALFDMVHENIPSDEKNKLLLEIFGREILNIMAYRGPERVHGPETNGKWEQRCMNHSLVQCHVNPDIIKKAQDRVKPDYKKDFVIKAENKNVLLGWKGRMVFTISVWRRTQML